MPLAIVAIVAMLFAFFVMNGPSGSQSDSSRPEEVILYIDPPPVAVDLGLSLPDRNPRR